jgi:hypothetical protein
MTYKELDVVVLTEDVGEYGLKAGDLGTVVFVSADALEVEFVLANGDTQALVTLSPGSVRPKGDRDLMAVRRADPPSRGVA